MIPVVSPSTGRALRALGSMPALAMVGVLRRRRDEAVARLVVVWRRKERRLEEVSLSSSILLAANLELEPRRVRSALVPVWIGIPEKARELANMFSAISIVNILFGFLVDCISTIIIIIY